MLVFLWVNLQFPCTLFRWLVDCGCLCRHCSAEKGFVHLKVLMAMGFWVFCGWCLLNEALIGFHFGVCSWVSFDKQKLRFFFRVCFCARVSFSWTKRTQRNVFKRRVDYISLRKNSFGSLKRRIQKVCGLAREGFMLKWLYEAVVYN